MLRQAKKESPKAKYGISIRWKLAVFMAVFVAIVLIITWLFQVFLLDLFFRNVKKSEMRESAKEIISDLTASELNSTVYAEAVDHALCVMVYRFEDDRIEQISNVDATGSNVIMSLDHERISEFYQKARKKNGSFFSRITLGGFEVNSDRDFWLDRMSYTDESGKPIRVPSKNVRLLYVEVAKAADGAQYMLLLDTSLQPLNATVQTLGIQFSWIALIVLLLAAGMVFLLYSHISKPLISMNEAAKQLAKGKYDAEFSGAGYRETRELADTLNYASCELSKLDRLQKELIANISHDLRTPLTMIRGYGELMRDLPDENTPENVQLIIDEAARLSELVNDLLDLSKFQSGARTPQISVFPLTDAVREVLHRYDSLIKHRGYRVEFEASDEVFVAADRGMLLQVLYNLINNAINYTGEDRRVRVVQSLEGQTVRISVSDSGEGIRPEEMPLIWERYYKVDKVHQMAKIGTGLGLSIVKSVLELHHAAYGVNSTLGVGSTFWFALPITEPPQNNNLLTPSDTEE